MNFKELAETYDKLPSKKCKSSKDFRENEAIALVEHEFQSKELCKKAIERDPLQFAFIAKKTPAMVLAALVHDPSALAYVQQSEEMCVRAINAWGIPAFTLTHRKTPKIIEAALKKDGICIALIEDPTPEQQLWAVESTPSSLQFIYKPTFETCVKAVSLDKNTLRYVPKTIIEQWRKL